MRHGLRVVAFAAVASGLLAACSGDPETASPEQSSSHSPAESLQPTNSSPPPQGSRAPSGQANTPQPGAEVAIEDLAGRIDVPVEKIEAAVVQAVTWASGALGCPEPGQSYTQVLTDGYRLTLTAQGQEYAYHAGPDGKWFYCAHPVDPVGSGPARS